MNKPLKLLAFLLSGVSGLMCGAGLTSATAQNPALPPATPLLDGGTHAFKAYGAGPETSALEFVPVEGQPFHEALRFITIKETPNPWDYGSTAALTAPVHKGEVLWVSLWARRLTTRRESGEAQVEVALMQKVEGKEVRPLARRISVGPQWTQYSLPFTVHEDSETGQARLGFRYGYGPQSLEIGGIQLLDYGTKVKMEDLPRSVVRYEGWEANAPWRQAAAERIEKIRKGDLVVQVTDAAGKPVPDAEVEVRMKRHAFGWGTAIDESHIISSQNPDDVRYRQVLETYFNKIVFENSLKWGRWVEPHYKERVLAALPWFEEHKIPMRGHVMVWPSWQHLPKSMPALKGDPVALERAVTDHIAEQTKLLGGRMAEWDVINETYKHHDLMDILGRGAMVDWFKEARAGAPNTKLFYNDYTMFQPGEGAQYFYDTVKFLKDSGAPIDAFGEQGHFAGSPPGIPEVLATLDKFGGLGLPIQISEFDIDTDDEGLQTDFMRDFTTAIFSHPSVMGQMQWGFWEKAHWLPRAALWDKDWNLRPVGKVWTDLTTKTWWTNADGRTAANGAYATRGFYGDYEVTVKQDAKSKTVKFALSPENRACAVVLP